MACYLIACNESIPGKISARVAYFSASLPPPLPVLHGRFFLSRTWEVTQGHPPLHQRRHQWQSGSGDHALWMELETGDVGNHLA